MLLKPTTLIKNSLEKILFFYETQYFEIAQK